MRHKLGQFYSILARPWVKTLQLAVRPHLTLKAIVLLYKAKLGKSIPDKPPCFMPPKGVDKMELDRRVSERLSSMCMDNSRRLEDYLLQAQALKAQGNSLYNSHNYADVRSP